MTLEKWQKYYEKYKDQPMLDEEGYPTNIALDLISKWHRDDPIGWFNFIHELWCMVDYCWKTIELPEAILYELFTGDWYGNELIAEAMKQNERLWDDTWMYSQRGWHYTFEIDLSEIEEIYY